jgi:bifunctional non-homologous end joining protein LigD
MLSRLRLKSYAKTSGMKGLHVFVPLNHKGPTFEQTRDFSKAVATVIERDHPDLVTTRIAKLERKQRVFINWAQNSSTKTMVSVYSLRARESPFVSFPLTWPELSRAAAGRSPARLAVLHSEALRRVVEHGDRFRDVLTRQQTLPRL